MFGGVSGAAVDGKPGRFFSDGSTTMTTLETEPWWQVQLATSRDLGYVRLLGHETEIVKREVQVFTLRSKTRLEGTFKLNVTDAEGVTYVTGDIEYNATAGGARESLEAKLEALPHIGSVKVTRSSSSFESPFQRTWTVTFVSPEGDIPQMRLGSDADLTSYGNSFTFSTAQDGTSSGGIYSGGVSHKINAVHGPSWLMVFNSAEVAESSLSLEEAKARAAYKAYIPDNRPEINIPLPDGVHGRVVRVQLEGSGYLAISEFQVFELPFAPLSRSFPSNPLPLREEWNPILAEESLTAAFHGTYVSGQWVLRLRDTASEHSNDGVHRAAMYDVHGDGGVAGWELAVTDFFGNQFRFETDALVTIETLPKYGRLFVASSEKAAARAAAAVAAMGHDATLAPEIVIADGYDRFVGACNAHGAELDKGIDIGIGPRIDNTFGVGPSLSSRVLGPVAARNLIPAASRGRPNVWYYPVEDYLGPDDFSFSAKLGGVKSTEAWLVGISTRRCRIFETGEAHELCACGGPDLEVDEEQQDLCYSAVTRVCADGGSGLGGNKTNGNTRLNARMKVRMCSACRVTYRQQMTLVPESFAEYTADCLAEIDKVEEWLADEGYCETEYSLPCCQQDAVDSTATLTLEGPGLGVSRSFELSGMGSRQTDETDIRPVNGRECRCSQPPHPCPCRENLWARRRRD